MSIKKFLTELWYPGIHQTVELFPKQRDEKLFYQEENERLEKQVADLKAFIANMENRLSQEGNGVKKKVVITSKTDKKFWSEVQRNKGLSSVLHIQVYDLWRGEDHWVGEFYGQVDDTPIALLPYVSLINFQVSKEYQNQGIGQLIFQQAFDWLDVHEPTVREIRGKIAKNDDDYNHDRLVYLYQKLGAIIDWYPEEKIVNCYVAEFRIPLPNRKLVPLIH